MKLHALAFMFAFCFSALTTSANDSKYVELMQKNIKAIYEAKDLNGFRDAVNGFERIASVEKTKWEPLYYIAFGNIMMANFEQDNSKKDAYLDRAVEVLGQASALEPRESEIAALEGFASMLRISVDPQTRGMVYAPQAMQAYGKALALNPENPRALALMAQMQFGSAQFFGSPVTEACEMNKKADEKMKTYKSDNQLAPAWGQRMIESLMEKCK
jgi:hypothetical protein